MVILLLMTLQVQFVAGRSLGCSMDSSDSRSRQPMALDWDDIL